MDAWFAILGSDNIIFNIVQGQAPSPGDKFLPVEEAAEDESAFDAGDWIGVDIPLEDKCIIGIDPVGEFAIAIGDAPRVALRTIASLSIDIGIEPVAVTGEGGVLHQPVGVDILLEQLVVDPMVKGAFGVEGCGHRH